MGKRIRLSCKICGYQKEALIGAGMMCKNASAITDSLQNEDLQQWIKLETDSELIKYILENSLVYCHTCRKLDTAGLVKLETKSGDKITLGTKCKECHNELDILDCNTPVKCPQCENDDLAVEQIGLWD